MLTIEQLKSVADLATPLAMDTYDRENGAALVPLLAQEVRAASNHKQGTLEWWAAFPQMLEWIDRKVIQRAFKEAIEYEVKPYEVTFAFDRFLATFDSALVSAKQLAPKIAQAFGSGKLMRAYAPMRDNLVTYDGQDFFDTDHVHPDETVFSNVVSVTRTDAATPTSAEARAELKEAMGRLQQNSLVRDALVSTASADSGLVVIAKSYDVWAAYNDLLNEETIGTDTNRFRGQFTLLRDFSPLAGTENYVDVVWALAGGPRPTVLVIHEEPRGLQFDLGNSFTTREVPFGMEASYAFVTGFPQAAVRITP